MSTGSLSALKIEEPALLSFVTSLRREFRQKLCAVTQLYAVRGRSICVRLSFLEQGIHCQLDR